MLVLSRKKGERILIEIPPSVSPVMVTIEVVDHHRQTAKNYGLTE